MNVNKFDLMTSPSILLDATYHPALLSSGARIGIDLNDRSSNYLHKRKIDLVEDLGALIHIEVIH